MGIAKEAVAGFTPKRQRTQYTCMSASLSMALEACGIIADEDEVNRVMGAVPLHGASWEQAFAAAQHYGARVTFICPATLAQVKAYTDKGIAVMIAWNPEGRPWSHASVIRDVDDVNVVVADPNIPDPEQTTRTMAKADFYGKWYEKLESYLVRRPAMAVEREVTSDGKQVVASSRKLPMNSMPTRVASRYVNAFQFVLAQAFADQVGMPEGLNLIRLNNLILEVFHEILDYATQGNGVTMGAPEVISTEEIEIEYGDTKHFYEKGLEVSPPERSILDVEVPQTIRAQFKVHFTIRDLVIRFLETPRFGRFFREHKKELVNFFASRDNKVMLDKSFNILARKYPDMVKVAWDVVNEDALYDAYHDALLGEVEGSGNLINTIPTDVDFSFMGTNIHVQVTVRFTYKSDAKDFNVPEQDAPDRDEYWDR
jgi:hypothetical protein